MSEQRPPDDFVGVASRLDRATYENLRRALELGRWPDGRPLDARQRAICIDAVIAWERRHLPPEARTGFVERGGCGTGAGDDGREDVGAARPVRLLDGS